MIDRSVVGVCAVELGLATHDRAPRAVVGSCGVVEQVAGDAAFAVGFGQAERGELADDVWAAHLHPDARRRCHRPPASTAASSRRSFWLARRIAAAITGAAIAPNPAGVPRLRNVIRIPPSTGVQL